MMASSPVNEANPGIEPVHSAISDFNFLNSLLSRIGFIVSQLLCIWFQPIPLQFQNSFLDYLFAIDLNEIQTKS